MQVTIDQVGNHFEVFIRYRGSRWQSVHTTLEVSDYAFQACILIAAGYVNAGFSYTLTKD